MPRCGSEAISAPPVALRDAATATLLLPLREVPARISPSSPASFAPTGLPPASRVRCHSAAKPGWPRRGSSAA